MIKYRIRESYNGIYVEERGWFFWRTLKKDIGRDATRYATVYHKGVTWAKLAILEDLMAKLFYERGKRALALKLKQKTVTISEFTLDDGVFGAMLGAYASEVTEEVERVALLAAISIGLDESLIPAQFKRRSDDA